MIFLIIDSDSGDSLGSIEVPDDADDESILETLVTTGYIPPPADCYTITDGDYFLDDNERTVRDEYGDPVLCLAPESPDTTEETDDHERESTG